MWNRIKYQYFTVPEEAGERTNNFNIIRLISAFMVIYGHMCVFIGVPVVQFLGQEISTIAVKIFMIISGYLVTQSFLRDRNALRYGAKRFFRLIPGLAFIIIVTTVIIGALLTTLSPGEYFTNPVTWDYLKNILLQPQYHLPGVFYDNIYPVAVNGSLWTLPCEAFLYIISAVLIWIFYKVRFLKPGLIICAAGAVILNMVKLVFFPEMRIIIYGSNLPDWFSLAAFFFMGSLYNLPQLRKMLNIQWAVALTALFAMLRMSYIKSELILLFLLPYAVLSCALVPKPIFGNWFAKNDYSYGTYLYGFLVQQTVVHFLKPSGLSVNVYFVISSLITFGCAVISWHLIEGPAQRFSKRLLNTKWIHKMKKEPIVL